MSGNQQVHPSRIRLEASSVCQLECPACPTASGETKPVLGAGHLRLARFRQLLEDNPQLVHIELSNYGELFLNPELPAIMESAHQQGVRLTADNGANFNTVSESTLEALVKFRFHSITCSLDGVTQETYAQYRKGGDLDTVLANIHKLNQLKQRYGSPYPKLLWQFILFPHNQHQVEEARRMAEELGMRFRIKLAWNEDADQSPLVQIEGAGSRSEYRQRYGVNYKRELCRQLWRMPQINWDGRVMGCCRNFWGEFGGNAFEDGIGQVSNSTRMVYARRMLMGQVPAKQEIPCTTCDLYLDMHSSGRWLSASEIRIPAAILEWLYRRRLANTLTFAAAGALFRLAEAALEWRTKTG
ncbi:MAG: radical SAM protein [Acidimicrobiia bacterium]|nr:radical SAM protein [Acidimicrobiia bacterium]